jgi:hypothetical protein
VSAPSIGIAIQASAVIAPKTRACAAPAGRPGKTVSSIWGWKGAAAPMNVEDW